MGTVIALLTIGIALVFFNAKAVMKEKSSFKGALHKASIDMGEVEIEIGKLRREFAETLLEIQRDIISLEKSLESLKDNNQNMRNSEELKNNKDDLEFYDNLDKMTDIMDIDFNKVKDTSNEDASSKEAAPNSMKINEIQRLIDKGLTVEEIADKMKVAKGEILLIKELYLR